MTHLVIIVRYEAKGVVIRRLIEGCVCVEGGGEGRSRHMVNDDVEEKVHVPVMQSL